MSETDLSLIPGVSHERPTRSFPFACTPPSANRERDFRKMISAMSLNSGSWLRRSFIRAWPLNRHRLVGRERIDGEKTLRMAGEPVDGDHSDPGINLIQFTGFRSLEQVSPQEFNARQCSRVIEDKQVFPLYCVLHWPRDGEEPLANFVK